MIDTKTATVTTDENRAYSRINNFVAHRWINHSASYSERDLFSGQLGRIHTNSIEGFWAIVKRAIYGQFHHVSEKYWPLYLNELTFRYSGQCAPSVKPAAHSQFPRMGRDTIQISRPVSVHASRSWGDS